MKFSKAAVHCKTHRLPALRFEDSQLTSFSGLVVIQMLLARLELKEHLRRCFNHLKISPIFGHATIVLCWVVPLLLGYRQLRDIRYYSDDPLVPRTLGLSRLPDVATLSRGLAGADDESVKRLHGLLREGVVTGTPHRFLFILYLPQALRPCNPGSFGHASNSSTKSPSSLTSSSRRSTTTSSKSS